MSRPFPGRSLESLALCAALLLAAQPLPAEESPPPEATPSSAQLLALELFTAIADFDKAALCDALNRGASPESEFPAVAQAEPLRARYPDGPLYYYLRHEPGYTALMFAAATGNEMAVRILLMAGARPNQLSRKSKTFALWQAARNGHIGVMRLLMDITPGSEPTRYRVSVSLKLQQAVVWKDAAIALITPISSGKPSTPTRRGTFLVTNKYRNWTSNLYEARMPYFLRLSCGDFGLHAGNLPGYPASHGCIRLPEKNAKELYSMLPIGTLVEIE